MLHMAVSLIECIRQGREDEVLSLLESIKLADIDNQTVKRDGTPLFWACWKGYLTIVRLLLQKGANINSTTSWNSTPLHAASDGNRPEVIRYLIDNGANIDARSLSGDTACHLAAYRGYSHVVQILIENGANISILNNNRRTCHHEALNSGNQNLANYIEAVCDYVSPIGCGDGLMSSNNQTNTINNAKLKQCVSTPKDQHSRQSPRSKQYLDNQVFDWQFRHSKSRVPSESLECFQNSDPDLQNDLSIDTVTSSTGLSHLNIF